MWFMIMELHLLCKGHCKKIFEDDNKETKEFQLYFNFGHILFVGLAS